MNLGSDVWDLTSALVKTGGDVAKSAIESKRDTSVANTMENIARIRGMATGEGSSGSSGMSTSTIALIGGGGLILIVGIVLLSGRRR